VLSHGHYDHAGGFEKFLEANPQTRIYAMRCAGGEFYSESGGMHYIGIPDIIKDKYGDNFIYTDDVVLIDTGVYLVPHSTVGLEKIGKRAGLYEKINDKMMPDSFAHELSLVFDTPDGLVIFNSCSHGGVSNIINEVKMALPNQRIKAFVGGLHMIGMKDGVEICTFSDEEITELVNVLKSEGVEKIYTGHCTGKVGFDKIKKCFGETKTVALYSGAEISI
jgi:7,8-dihydropterin-6-yl-methyl-4-(beta-D-ribofuranosyl)aminobenzene 5'-phosphate synthase